MAEPILTSGPPETSEPIEDKPGIYVKDFLINPLTQKIAGFVSNFAAAIVNRVWRAFMPEVVDPLIRRANDGIKALENGEDASWAAIMESLIDAGIIDRTVANQLKKFSGLPLGTNSLFNLIILGAWLTNYVQHFASATLAPYQQKLNQEFTPNLPSPSAALTAGIMYPDKQRQVKEILARHGYTEDHMNLLNLSMHRMYDVGTALQLYLRKELDDSELKDRMYKLGYTSDVVDELKKVTQIIPPVSDILMMVGKEAFEPDQIERFGLGEEFPEEQVDWLEKQGLSRYWQEKYWAAHWNYPAPGQVLEMLHRGLISETDVAEFYRVVEIPKFWRDKLEKISYRPYTRVDTRRMHAMGVLSNDDLVNEYKVQGYDQTRAEKLAEFTIRYNADADKKLSQAQILKAFRNGMISRQDAQGFLEQIKLSRDYADWILSLAEFEENLELQALYVTAIKTRFLEGVLNDVEARNELGKLNLQGAKIEALLTTWRATQTSRAALPSKTDLDKFLKAQIIDQDTYRIQMTRLGYSWQYTDWYIQAAQKSK